MLLNVGSGGGAAPAAAASGSGAAAGGAAAAEETKEEEKKEEGKHAVTRQNKQGLTFANREGRIRRGYGFRSLRLSAFSQYITPCFKPLHDYFVTHYRNTTCMLQYVCM